MEVIDYSAGTGNMQGESGISQKTEKQEVFKNQKDTSK